jgi:hypothetical protein
MPNIRYMSWNIQNFGQTTAAQTQLKGANSSRLAQFIAGLVNMFQIDILGIMEVTPTALPHLNNLLFALNNVMGVNDWCFDWIKGSVDNNLPASPVNAPGNLTWRSDRNGNRLEGYAFFWRNGSADFTMLRARDNMSEGARLEVGYAPAYVPGNAASLSLQGRDITPARSGSTRPRPQANFAPAAVSALDFDYAFYPETSKVGAWDIFWSESRRPAYVLIRMEGIGGGDAQRVVPLALYHAPSYKSIARVGTFIGGMERELYAIRSIDVNERPTGALIHNLKFVASGDYNLAPTQAIWRDYYSGFFNAFAATRGPHPAGGANGTALYDYNGNLNTTVQLQQFNHGLFNGPPIAGVNVNDYYFAPIDNMFQRGLTLHGGANDYFAWNLVDEVMQGNANVVAGIQAYAAGLNAIAAAALGGVNAVTGPLNNAGNPIFGFFTDWNNFIADVNNGIFTTARSAAEFVRMFVSDHSPLVIDFDVV